MESTTRDEFIVLCAQNLMRTAERRKLLHDVNNAEIALLTQRFLRFATRPAILFNRVRGLWLPFAVPNATRPS